MYLSIPIFYYYYHYYFYTTPLHLGGKYCTFSLLCIYLNISYSADKFDQYFIWHQSLSPTFKTIYLNSKVKKNLKKNLQI